MSRINSFYCRQSAMKLASLSENEMTDENRNDLREYNNAARKLDTCKRLHVPQSFKEDLDIELQHIGAYDEDRQSGGVVSDKIVQAKFEADYIMGYRVQNNISSCVYSSDGDMNTLCSPLSLCVRDFGEEKGSMKRTREDDDICSPVLVYEVTGCSNTLMDEIKQYIDKTLMENGIKSESRRQWLMMNLITKRVNGKELYDWNFNFEVLQNCFRQNLILVPQDALTCNSVYPKKTLFIGSPISNYIPRDSHDEIKKYFPQAEFVYIDGAGHWVQADKPKEFISVVLKFLVS